MTRHTDEAKVMDFETIRSHWDGAAARYDSDLPTRHTVTPGLTAASRRAWELQVRRLVGPPPAHVLDVGTGTGLLALMLASLSYRVTAVDAAAAMVETTARKAAAAGLTVEVHEARAERLPFGDGVFDAVINRIVFWMMLDPEATVREWRRCTRAGGRITVIDCQHGDIGLDRIDRARRWLCGLLNGRPAVGSLFHVQQMAQLPLWGSDITRSYPNVFSRAGLIDIRVEELAGIRHFERHERAQRYRLGPARPLYLIEGTVPAGP
ncbi:MAG: methyltransferase domain-containing protein [Egibacteraceae bacterium]